MTATCLLKRDNFLHSPLVRLWLCHRHSTSPLCTTSCFCSLPGCISVAPGLHGLQKQKAQQPGAQIHVAKQNRTAMADTPGEYRFHYFLLPKVDHDLTAQCFLSHQPLCWLAVAALCWKNLSCSHNSDSERHQAWCDAWGKGTSLSGKQSSFVQGSHL